MEKNWFKKFLEFTKGKKLIPVKTLGDKTNQEILEDIDRWCEDYSPYDWKSWFEENRFIYQFFFPDDTQDINELIEVLELCDYIEERFLIGYFCQSTLFNEYKGEICLRVEFIKD